VIGIVSQPQGGSPADVYIPLGRAEALAGMKNQVNTIYVAASSATMIPAVSSEISRITPKATVTTSSDLANEVTGSLASAASLARNLGKWLAVAVLAAAFLLASLLTISAVSRRVREFSTLKAPGWRSRRVVGQALGESVTIGVIGGLGGIVLGLAGAAASAVTVHLSVPVTLGAVALAVILAIAGGLVAGSFGGWRAARLRPADALARVE
jgi:ABC-type antimicrobial peptide transport system permease subunit